MCGIVGYIGKNKAIDILLDGLSKLEYRGYDSAGIAIREEDIKIYKAKGKIVNLVEKIKDKKIEGTCGIGHTRWATHGEPSENNAHPHISNNKEITLVHNGIIENYAEIKNELEKDGYKFYSETDTEVLANLIEYYYKKSNLGPNAAINKAMNKVRGSYAIVLMFKEYPNELWVARKDSPMIIGKSDTGMYIASDVPAILKYTKDVYYIDNLESACIKNNEIDFYDINGKKIEKELKTIEWDIASSQKDGYDHFMIKEIYEQPTAIEKTITSFVNNGKIDFNKCGLSKEILKDISQVYIVACGSAYHTGVCASYVIEELAKVPVRVDIASEFRYRNPLLKKDELVIIISQSGETADSLAALREAKKMGIKTMAIVNVVGSSIAREADYVLYTLAGPEIAVATTKAFSTQLIVLDLFAIELANSKKEINNSKYKELINEITLIPNKIKEILDNNVDNIKKISSKFSKATDAFYIGRGLDYAISLEGSLKLKEISYIHSEAYAAGELKHGTISLIEKNTLVIGVVTQKDLYEKTISNLIEVKSRGGYIIGVSSDDIDISKVADTSIKIPNTIKYFCPSLTVIPLQLLGYYISVARGLDVDKPRNLAKSVTVE